MRLLYLIPREFFLKKISRVRFHQIEEISKISEVKYSGFGWNNYNSEKSVSFNVKNIYKGELPDAIIAFDHYTLINFKECMIPKVIMMNEMHSPEGNKYEALDMLNSGGYNLIVCHHKNEMENSIFNEIKKKMVNIPHHVNTSIFKDYNLEKTTDVLLCGNLNLDKYKLRKRFVKIIEELQNLGIKAKIHKHPGGPKDDAYTNKYMIDFAKAINSSKICLTCSSIFKCAFAKYVEIPMCNSLVGGDIPNERQDFFKSFVLELNEKQTNEEMIKVILDTLKDEKKLNEMTNIGHQKNKIFSMDNYAKKFIEELNKFLVKKF